MMMVKVFLALAALASTASADTSTYMVEEKYAKADTNCSGTATSTTSMAFDAFTGMMLASMGAEPGAKCGTEGSNFIGISSAAGKCKVHMYTDKTCATEVTGMEGGKAWGPQVPANPKEDCEEDDDDGKKIHVKRTCSSSVQGRDLSCFSQADMIALMASLKNNSDGNMPCTSTCTATPKTCDELTTVFGGCASTCSAAEKQTARMMVMVDSSSTLDCKCAAGAPAGGSGTKGTTSGNQHIFPSLMSLVIAAVMAAA